MTKDDLTRLALELPIDERLDLAQTLWEEVERESKDQARRRLELP